MIYTVTFNPAVDYVMHIGSIEAGSVNRSIREEIYFGGKGINVSLILNELGIRSKALGFAAGFTGLAIEDGLRQKGIETDLVHLKSGFSRINVKIRADGKNASNENSNNTTELNGQGPEITTEALDELFGRLNALKDGDTLVLAGSVPKSLPEDIYEKILEALSDRDIRVAVDAEGKLLLNVLKYKPFLVKPNSRELGDMFGTALKTIEEIEEYAIKLREMGAKNVLVSMAGDGALLLDENGKTHIRKACVGTVKNPVGAGDSMVAGFIAGLQNGGFDYALMLGTAAGGATAFSDGPAQRDEIYGLLEQMKAE